MSHFVYMLQCAGSRIYTGYAVDVQARFKQHCAGRGARFTKAFPPEKILIFFELSSKEQALRMEARIKMLKRDDKIRLSSGDKELLETLMSTLDAPLPKKKKRKQTKSD